MSNKTKINGLFLKSDINTITDCELEPGRFSKDDDVMRLEEIPSNAIIMERATPIQSKDGVIVSMPDILVGITGRLIFIPSDSP